MSIDRRTFILISAAGLLMPLHTVRAQDSRPAAARTEFLRLCDLAISALDQPERNPGYYNDSYPVRALAVTYDLTGQKRYLESCQRWSDRMVEHQRDMTPAGAYYMGYNRKPGEPTGAWYVADSSSIAMGVLATAVRSSGPQRQRYMDSVRSFAKLVMDNYVGPGGGIRNGLWPKYDGEWWCCSGIFGSLAFLMYDETGEERYLQVGLGALDWLNRYALGEFQPYSLDEMGPTMPMYVLEAYSAALPHVVADAKGAPDKPRAQARGVAAAPRGGRSEPEAQVGDRRTAMLKRWQEALDWMAANQASVASHRRDAGATPAGPASAPTTMRGPSGHVIWKPGDYTSQWGGKLGGLPFHMYVYAHFVPGSDKVRRAADRELDHIAGQLPNEKPAPKWAGLSQLAGFAMFSYAERVLPGAVYRSERSSRLPAP